MKSYLFFILLVISIVFLSGCAQTYLAENSTVNNTINSTGNTAINTTTDINSSIEAPTKNYTYVGSFDDNGKEICTIDGKPVIRLYSTTWCPHCQWIKDTFDKVAKEYVAAGKIVAYHWEMDTKDNTLTDTVETSIPAEESQYFSEGNSNGYIPHFVFGCKYTRTGNKYEGLTGGLEAEESEFRGLVEKILDETKTS